MFTRICSIGEHCPFLNLGISTRLTHSQKAFNINVSRILSAYRNVFRCFCSFALLYLLLNCKPADLNAACDPSSKNFFLSKLISPNQSCTGQIDPSKSQPLHSLYLSDVSNGLLYTFNTRNDGVLSLKGSIATSLTNPFTILWNGRHLVINGANQFQSYLRNSDGSLSLKNTYVASVTPVLIQGTTAFHPSGKFFYYTVNTATSITSFSKLQLDSEGTFSGEANTVTGQNWSVMGPIHPTGNYFMTFHKLSAATRMFYPIADVNTGAVGTPTSNATVTDTTLYPENGHCIYSSNANFLYCANNSNLGNNGSIVQMSVTSTSNAVLAPSSVLVQSPTAYLSPKSIVLHPSGQYIYAYGETNIYAYAVDQVTGVINATVLSSVPTPGGASCTSNSNVTRLAIHPLGNMLYAVCVSTNGSNHLGSYPINSSGQLSLPTLITIPNTTNSMNLLFVSGN